jgi:hypothetical protein
MQKIIYSIFLFFTAAYGFAQNTTSPYSIIGIGDIQQSYFDRSSGMANTGISLSSGRYLYHANPASYAKLEDHYFAMEVAARYKDITYAGNGVNINSNRSNDISIEKLAFAHKLKPWWAVSIGIMPYSTSNYSFSSTKDIQGTSLTTVADYEGTGGLNQAYIANAFNITKNLRVGLQTTALFGNFTQTETLYTNGLSITGSPVVTTAKIYTSKILLKGGIQYDVKLNRNWGLNIGAIASKKTTFNADYDITVTDDTGTIASIKTYKTNYFTLPSVYGAGIALVNKNKITFSADYQRQLWSNLNYKGYNYQLVNSNRVSAGFEYANRIPYMQGFVEKYYVQAGAYYSNSYLKMYGQQLQDYGISVGAGFNSKKSQFAYLLSLEIGKRGTVQNNLIRENYVQVGITLTYRDFWFTKVKKFND